MHEFDAFSDPERRIARLRAFADAARTGMPNARPDNSHLYAEAYAEAHALAEVMTVQRQPVVPHTVMAMALLEVVGELMEAPIVGNLAREAVAESAARLLGGIARPLPYDAQAKLDHLMWESMGHG